jgi:hypothetical protein
VVVAAVGGAPEKDPRFQGVMEQLDASAQQAGGHPPASQKAAEAQAAAASPPNEGAAGAKANQVDAMQSAEAPRADSSGFLALLRQEIERVMPQTLEDATRFMQGGEKSQVKSAVSGAVRAQKDAAAGPTEQAARATPDASGPSARRAEPLREEHAVAPPPINAAEAMPAPRSDADVATLQRGNQDAAAQLEEAKLTPEQLQKANDPRFSAVLTAKENVEALATKAPREYRASEQATLGQATAAATAEASTGLAQMASLKGASGAKVMAQQLQSKQEDEARRKKVTDTLERIYQQTQERVDAKLSTLEADVMRMFDAGAEAALSDLQTSAKREIARFYDARYTGVEGAALWLIDKLGPVPEEVQAILRRERARFATKMDELAQQIAATVDGRLSEAKAEVNKGQAEIQKYVASLPGDLREVGQQAEQAITSRFDELRSGIDARATELAQKLAQKYKEAHDSADAALKKLEEENENARTKLEKAVKEVVKILTELKEKLMGVLRQGADTLDLILKDPIQFLSNLIGAVKQGFQQFAGNIAAHLKKGFMQWLFGALTEAGIQVPSDLNAWSILKLVLDVLNLTYTWIRSEAVKLAGERNVALLEKLVDLITTTIQAGPQALWEKLKEDLSNLKEMVVDAIQTWLIDTVVRQAVTKVLSMFNPAGAIVQAVIAIYNVVMWFVENASRISALVEAVVNSVHAIATGAIGGAAAWIERSLANLLPIAIAFLARLIGLGGLSGKIREFITKVQMKVRAAILGWLKKAWAWVKKTAGGLLGKLTGEGKKDERTDAEKAADLAKALGEAEALLRVPNITEDKIRKGLVAIKRKYHMASLVLVIERNEPTKNVVHVEGAINPHGSTPSTTLPKDPNINVSFSRGRHTIAGVLRANSLNKKDNTILVQDVSIEAVRSAARAAYLASPKNGGEFEAEGVKWRFDRLGPAGKPDEQYLHIYPMHSPPIAINLSRQENKAVTTYQQNRNAGKDHATALAKVQELAAALPGAFSLSGNAMIIIEQIK